MAGSLRERADRAPEARLLYRPVALGLAVVLLALAAVEAVQQALSAWGAAYAGTDLTQGYLPGAQRWLSTGSPYTAEQLAGPWVLEAHSFIHPPAALPLFAAFLVLPIVLWWAVPIGVTALAVARMRPAPWSWPLMAACLVWPRSPGSLISGNSDMWAMAAVGAGAVWGWPIVLLAVKPTFAPLALVAVRNRWAWVAGAIVAVPMLLMLPLWLDWLRVIANASLPLTYSVLNLPLVLLPAVAWAARAGRPRQSARTID